LVRWISSNKTAQIDYNLNEIKVYCGDGYIFVSIYLFSIRNRMHTIHCSMTYDSRTGHTRHVSALTVAHTWARRYSTWPCDRDSREKKISCNRATQKLFPRCERSNGRLAGSAYDVYLVA